jgi:hypothetical protein
MNIKIMEIGKCKNFEHCYQADCEDCPGMPPVGYGKTPEEAVAALFYLLLFDKTGGPDSKNWIEYIKFGEPIIINGKMWEDPMKG